MSILRSTVDKINVVYTSVITTGIKQLCRKNYKKLLNRHPISRAEGEADFISKWLPLSKHPHLPSYRLFSQYIGPNPDIVPEEVSSNIIQPILNPIETRPYYQDKNAFEKILPPSFLPEALFRMVNGAYLTADYKPLGELSDKRLDELTEGIDTLFIKPATDSSSGQGVLKFSRDTSGKLVCKNNASSFDINFLKEYSKSNSNFIVQKALSQSDYIAQFNPSSINTLRVATYKSVVDNRTHVCAIILRIGKKGADVDNAHAGGLFVGVGLDGTLCKYACDQYGNRYDTFNGIDFKNGEFRIPEFEKVISFAEKVGDNIMHHRLVAQDICLQANGEPCLVEFNIRAFSVWLFQFTIGPALGKYTDEIIDYCAKRKKEVRKVFVEPF